MARWGRAGTREIVGARPRPRRPIAGRRKGETRVVVEGTHVLPGTPEVVWNVLLDPEVIGRTMPGAEHMVRMADDRYAGKMRLGIGPIIAVELDLTITLTDVVPSERYTMLIDGRGRFGFTRGSAEVRLAPNAAGSSTVMHFKADLEVGGRVAAVGQRLLGSVSRLMTRQGFESLSREVAKRLAAGALGEGLGDLGLRGREPTAWEPPRIEPLARETGFPAGARPPAADPPLRDGPGSS
jgi:carbon monoxide dehydrogenase subunit G